MNNVVDLSSDTDESETVVVDSNIIELPLPLYRPLVITPPTTPTGERKRKRINKWKIIANSLCDAGTGLECPICFDIVKSLEDNPTCSHVICATCKLELKNCPICRKKYSSIHQRHVDHYRTWKTQVNNNE